MGSRTLRAWLKRLEKDGELTRISVPVSPILEISEIADRMVRHGGNALLFEQVEGSPFPLFIGGYATEKRMAHAFGIQSLDQISRSIARYFSFENYASFPRFFRALPRLMRFFCCITPRIPGKAACQQTINYDPDLSILPALQCWPKDGGRFLTMPLVFTKLPGGRVQNLGIYRMQLLGRASAAIHWQAHRDGHAIFEAWRAKGGRMPIAVVLGADAAITYAASAPLLPGIDELLLAGFLRKMPVRLVRCVTNDLYVPSNAQFVLEGFIDMDDPLVEAGPFGAQSGYYAPMALCPLVHFTCLTHCKNPIFPATLLGKPPKESNIFHLTTDRLLLPILRTQIAQLQNLSRPFAGGVNNCTIISVKNIFPGAATAAMHALWGTVALRCCKLIVAVDEQIDLCDLQAVLMEVLSHVRPDQDCLYSHGPVDELDHASIQQLYGGRLGIDATRKARRARAPGRLHLVKVRKKQPFAGREAAFHALEWDPSIRLAVAIDAEDAALPASELLWKILGSIDVARDLIVHNGCIAVDATEKLPEEGARPWPEPACMTDSIRALVDARWQEYGLPDLPLD